MATSAFLPGVDLPQRVVDVFDAEFVDGGVEHVYADAVARFGTDDLVVLAAANKIAVVPREEFLQKALPTILARDPLARDPAFESWIRNVLRQSVRQKTGVTGYWLVVRDEDSDREYAHVVSMKVYLNEEE